MDNQNPVYEVLNPWAEADPVNLRGISDRVADLNGKTVGLLANVKKAGVPILKVIEQKLLKRYPNIKSVWATTRPTSMQRSYLALEDEPVTQEYRDWINGVDTVIAAVGD